MSSALAYVRWLTEAHRSVIGADKAEHLDKLFNTIEESDKTANEIYDLMGTECSSDDSPFENAVISVLSCVVCKMYVEESQKYLPEDIENIQVDKLDSFFGYLTEFPSAEECFDHFCREVCL